MASTAQQRTGSRLVARVLTLPVLVAETCRVSAGANATLKLQGCRVALGVQMANNAGAGRLARYRVPARNNQAGQEFCGAGTVEAVDSEPTAGRNVREIRARGCSQKLT